MTKTLSDFLLHIVKTSEEDKENLEFIDYLKEISILKELLPCLIENKVVNIFYYYLVEHNLTYLLDKSTYKLLNQIVTHSTLKAQEYENDFNSISFELEKNNIPYVILKGFHLNNALYGKPKGFILRDYNDIDVLVNKKDLIKINSILKEKGYIQGNLDRKSLNIVPCDRREKIDMIINTHQQYQQIKPSIYFPVSHYNIQLIDINFTIWEGGDQPDYIDTSFLLEHRIPRETTLGVKYWSLEPMYELLQLCYHLYKDTKYDIKKQNNEVLRMIHFYDILFLINLYREEIVWEELLQTIIKAKLQNQIYYVLWLLQNLFPYVKINSFLDNLSQSVDEDTKRNGLLSLQCILNQEFR